MAKRVFIIHGWGGNPHEAWLPWLKTELEKEGFVVEVPTMPQTNEPTIAVWVEYLAKTVGEPDNDTYFVGHSIGCQAIMRYLATLEDTKVGGCVFVAGWFKLENMEDATEEKIAEPWLTTPIDFAKVRAATPNITVILSDNEPYGAVAENKELFEKALGATVHVEHNKGHFSEDNGITELPEALEAIQAMSGDAL